MITFRDAAESDLPAIVALLADDVLGSGREATGAGLPEAYRTGFRAMRAQDGVIILAVDGEEVVGCLQLNIIHGVSQLGARRGHVEAVRVATGRRGGGIGAALMGEAIRRAREAGCRLVQLTSNLRRADARRFYERLGFIHSHAGMKLALD